MSVHQLYQIFCSLKLHVISFINEIVLPLHLRIATCIFVSSHSLFF